MCIHIIAVPSHRILKCNKISAIFPVGKHSVAGVLSLGDGVTALLPFLEPHYQRDHDNKLKKSSVSSRYAAVLILQLLQSES